MITPKIIKAVRDREEAIATARREIEADHWTPDLAARYVRELGPSFGQGDAFSRAFDHEIAKLAAKADRRAA